MIKRVLDIVLAGTVLMLTAPLLLIAVLGVKLSSPGPVFYRAVRVGRRGGTFHMLKLRSMHVSDSGPVITAQGDTRVFGFGRFIRATKLDELPQLVNVLRGDMSVVGPRPEDPTIVRDFYSDWMMETLNVRPGLTSPGAVFYYTCCEGLIDPERPEESYVDRVLPMKLAIDRAYMDRATLLSDGLTVLQTAAAIVAAAIGLQIRPSTRDLEAAKAWAAMPDLT